MSLPRQRNQNPSYRGFLQIVSGGPAQMETAAPTGAHSCLSIRQSACGGDASTAGAADGRRCPSRTMAPKPRQSPSVALAATPGRVARHCASQQSATTMPGLIPIQYGASLPWRAVRNPARRRKQPLAGRFQGSRKAKSSARAIGFRSRHEIPAARECPPKRDTGGSRKKPLSVQPENRTINQDEHRPLFHAKSANQHRAYLY